MRTPSPQPNIATSPAEPGFILQFWLIVVVAGVGAGLVGGLLMCLLHGVEHFVWPFRPGGDLLDAFKNASAARRVVCLTGAGAWIGFAGLLLRRVFGPSGEINSNVWFHSGRLPPIATIARGVVSIVAVALGMSLGREAAVKQSGAAVASGLAGWARLPAPHRRVLVACGVGAGMAAAYNVPLGGALFALEVLLGTLSLRLVLPAVVMSTVATATSWIFLPAAPIYSVPVTHLSAAITAWAVICGPLFGVVAALFIKAIAWAGRVRWHGSAAVIAPIVTLGLLGILSIAFPELLGNGKEAVQLAFDGKVAWSLLLVLPLLKGIATTGCLSSGARGGLFTPTMMIGAVFGGLLGSVWGYWWPGTDLGLCAMVGSGAVLAAATQGPVSALVLVLELTRHGDAIMVQTLLAVTGATLTAGWLDGRSLYSARSAPAIGNDSVGRHTVSSAATLPSVVQLLLSLSTNAAIPSIVIVVDEEGRSIGKIRPADVESIRFRPLPLTAVTAGDVAQPLDGK